MYYLPEAECWNVGNYLQDLHSVTTQKTLVDILTAVRTSNLILLDFHARNKLEHNLNHCYIDMNSAICFWCYERQYLLFLFYECGREEY